MPPSPFPRHAPVRSGTAQFTVRTTLPPVHGLRSLASYSGRGHTEPQTRDHIQTASRAGPSRTGLFSLSLCHGGDLPAILEMRFGRVTPLPSRAARSLRGEEEGGGESPQNHTSSSSPPRKQQQSASTARWCRCCPNPSHSQRVRSRYQSSRPLPASSDPTCKSKRFFSHTDRYLNRHRHRARTAGSDHENETAENCSAFIL